MDGETKYQYWSGSQLAYEVNSENESVYYLSLETLGRKVNSSNPEYYLYNAHGDVVQLTDNTGIVERSYDYDTFGNELSPNENDNNPLRYNGQYWDEETQTYYLRARQYNPVTGRFTTEDPIADGLNWYVYCNNNPVMLVDPSGLEPTKEEAASIAYHIYDHDLTSSETERIIAGWKLIDVFDGGDALSIKLGIYIPEDDDSANPSEYVLAFRGSTVNFKELETWGVWANNLLAFTSNASPDMWAVIAIARYFDATHSQEITFVGHSKGGGEAIAAAEATNNNAITFNAANFNFLKYGLLGISQSEINNYYIQGEILSSLPGVGKSQYATNIPEDVEYWNTYNIFGLNVRIPAFFKNHSIYAFRDAWGLEW